MKKGRPKKVRYIQEMPTITQFSPRGRPGRPDEVVVTLDELEAVKLADYHGLVQSDGALAMKISRPSFGRILKAGRKKIADALVNGKIIRIRLGDAQVGVTRQLPLAARLREGVREFQEEAAGVIRDLMEGEGRLVLKRNEGVVSDGDKI